MIPETKNPTNVGFKNCEKPSLSGPRMAPDY